MRGVGGEVQQRAGYRRHRYVVMEDSLQVPRAMQGQPLDRLAVVPHADVDEVGWPPDQTPPVRGGPVAERRAVARIEQRGHEPALVVNAVWPTA